MAGDDDRGKSALLPKGTLGSHSLGRAVKEHATPSERPLATTRRQRTCERLPLGQAAMLQVSGGYEALAKRHRERSRYRGTSDAAAATRRRCGSTSAGRSTSSRARCSRAPDEAARVPCPATSCRRSSPSSFRSAEVTTHRHKAEEEINAFNGALASLWARWMRRCWPLRA